MGSADIIPGVSGGTIALITGIYERLVDTIRAINFKFIFYFFKGFFDKKYFKKAKDNFLSVDWVFLSILALGIGIAFLSLANVIGVLLEFYPSYTYSFFFGLIISSAFFVYFLNRKVIKFWDIVFCFVGVAFGFLIVGLSSVEASHTFYVVFLAGMVTFCAMILPGISGAFILLVLGQYEFMLDILRDMANFDFSGIFYAISYVLGGVAGLLLFSRVLSYLFKRYHGATLMFIVGLMIGALRDPADRIMMQPDNMYITLAAGCLGVLVVSIVSYYGFSVSEDKISV